MAVNSKIELPSGVVVKLVRGLFPDRSFTQSSLSNYRKKGFLPPSGEVVKSGGRYYTVGDVYKLCSMLELKKQGVSLKLSKHLDINIEEGAAELYENYTTVSLNIEGIVESVDQGLFNYIDK